MSMADEAQSSLPPAASSGELITSVNHNDVLMGRGTGPNEFIGNQRFRQIVEQRNEEYKMAPKNKGKTKIARKLVSQVHEAGGRFLKQIETENSEEALWYEVEEKIALEKCRQASRDLWKQQVSSDGKGGRKHGREEDRLLERNVNDLTAPGVTLPQSSAGLRHGLVAVAPPSLVRAQVDSTSLSVPPRNLTQMLPWILAENTGPRAADLDERLLLFRATPFAFEEPFTMQQPMATNPFLPPQFNFSVHNQNGFRIPYADSMLHGSLQEQYGCVNSGAAAAHSALSLWLQSARPQIYSVSHELKQSSRNLRVSTKGKVVADQSDSGCTATTGGHSMSENDVTAAAPEVDMSEFLLPVFEQDSNIPRFTAEQEEIERATMTDEDKAAALSDLFGTYCAVSIHKNKRARLEMHKNSTDFLVKKMRLQLERIPLDRKRALVEAQSKCREDEFSDARLERFLRCEGMNAKLGAQRFVHYWESRREVFGQEKFALRMTLSEALCNDLVAIEACLCRLLPHLDTSGRQLLIVEPCRHTREGYTLESMLRAVWYVIEVTAQENTDIRSGYVRIVWDKEFTIWDYDHILYERMTYFDMNCWPVKSNASHTCFSSWIIVNIVKPILYPLIDKHARSRILYHAVPESEILDVLSCYGILKNMLPTEMGGTVWLDQAKWIANRRAAELGEI